MSFTSKPGAISVKINPSAVKFENRPFAHVDYFLPFFQGKSGIEGPVLELAGPL